MIYFFHQICITNDKIDQINIFSCLKNIINESCGHLALDKERDNAQKLLKKLPNNDFHRIVRLKT